MQALPGASVQHICGENVGRFGSRVTKVANNACWLGLTNKGMRRCFSFQVFFLLRVHISGQAAVQPVHVRQVCFYMLEQTD